MLNNPHGETERGAWTPTRLARTTLAAIREIDHTTPRKDDIVLVRQDTAAQRDTQEQWRIRAGHPPTTHARATSCGGLTG